MSLGPVGSIGGLFVGCRKGMALKFITAFVVLVAVLLNSHGLVEFLNSKTLCDELNYVRDQATVTFSNHLDKHLYLYAKSQNCWKCSPIKKGNILPLRNVSVNFSTNFGVDLHVVKRSHTFICNISMELHDRNMYYVELTKTACNVTSLCSDLPDPNIPVYWLLGSIVILFVIWHVCLALWRRGCFAALVLIKSKIKEKTGMHFTRNSEEESDTGIEGSTVALIQADLGSVEVLPKIRIHSVDTLRGISLLLMIFVNYGGGGYWYLGHEAWDGLTVADIIFPSFVFVMGMSVAISFHSQQKKKKKRFQIFLSVVRRSAMLFGLGLMTSNRNVPISNLRIPGVLQRLSITYLVVGMVESLETNTVPPSVNKWWSCLRDIIIFWKGWMMVIVSLVLHSCLTFLLPVPGCPMGYLGPGGLHDEGKYMDCTGGAAGYIDRQVFGPNHIYQRPTCKETYQTTVPYDPEGILGTLLSIVMCYFGLQAGRILLTYGDSRGKLIRWMLWALMLGSIGGGLCEFKKFGGLIPLNKNLWSLSFTCVTSAMTLALFSIIFLLVDHFRVWTGAPFVYPGMNSIVVYIGSELLKSCFPLHLYSPSTHCGLILVHTWDVLFWIIVSMVMYTNGVFVAL